MGKWKVILASPPLLQHQLLTQFLLRITAEFTDFYNLGEVMFAPFQMYLSKIRRGREPDLIFIKNEHLSRLKKNYLDGPADLAVEIISPKAWFGIAT